MLRCIRHRPALLCAVSPGVDLLCSVTRLRGGSAAFHAAVLCGALSSSAVQRADLPCAALPFDKLCYAALRCVVSLCFVLRCATPLKGALPCAEHGVVPCIALRCVVSSCIMLCCAALSSCAVVQRSAALCHFGDLLSLRCPV